MLAAMKKPSLTFFTSGDAKEGVLKIAKDGI
jgi:hypothetical protein